MARESAIKVVGVVLEALPNGTYRAELSNGHQLTAFQTGRERRALVPGQQVMLQLTPYDLSQGRVLAH
jgi:translation initiation factor IF-1